MKGAEGSLAEAKAALRRRMRALRDALPEAERERLGALVAERLLGLPEVARARGVLLFYSFGSEVPTAGVAARLHESGARLFLPYLEDGAMEAAEVGPGDPLLPSGYGPREPARRARVDPERVDLVVVPGLAFDRRGHRLGYGGGHYDRYLGRVGRAARVGIGFSFQLLDEVPAGPGDRRLDLVVTDAETVVCRGEAGEGRL